MSAERDFFLDAVAIEAEHRRNERECPRCNGRGEVFKEGWSLNRRAGVMAPDPQEDRSQECGLCDGTGGVPIFSIRKRG